MKNEVWRNISGYEKKYQVSNLGRVKSLITNKILKQFKRSKSYPYYCVNLCKNKKHKLYAIHKLVAETFLNKKTNLECINHKNGNKLDNRLINLEFCTYSENTKHSYKNKLQKPKRGKNNNYTKAINQYDLQGNFIKTWYGGYEIKKEFGKCSPSNIYQCAKGKRKTAYNYIWKYFIK